MKRTFATTTFAFALLGVAACKGGGGADAAKLIPDAATFVGGADLAGLQSTALWKDKFQKKFEEEGKEQLEAMKACNLGLDKFKSVTVGADPTGGDDKMAVVIVADGIGVKENIDCAHGKIKEKSGEEPWTSEEDGKVLKMKKGQTAFVVKDDTIVLAGKDWADSVKKLVGGEGTSAMDGGLKDIIGKTDTGKHIWFAGNIPAEMAGGAAGQLGATPKSVAGWADLSGDVSFFVAVGLASSEEAEATKTKVQGLWDAMGKDMAKSQAGLSDDVVNGIEIGADGDAVTIKATIPEKEVTAAVDKLPM